MFTSLIVQIKLASHCKVHSFAHVFTSLIVQIKPFDKRSVLPLLSVYIPNSSDKTQGIIFMSKQFGVFTSLIVQIKPLRATNFPTASSNVYIPNSSDKTRQEGTKITIFVKYLHP